jgi:LPXTG-motif cell wall-anchored protein
MPFYWGSFYVLGNTEPVIFESGTSITQTILIVFGILFAIILGYFFIRKRGQKR